MAQRTECEECAYGRDTYDYGYDLPDLRATYEIREVEPTGLEFERAVCDSCEPKGTADRAICGDHWFGDEDGRGEITGTVKVTIKRLHRPCDCGSGHMAFYGTNTLISGPGSTLEVPPWTDTRALIRAVWPTAEEPERDEAWESERWLRRAEGWGC